MFTTKRPPSAAALLSGLVLCLTIQATSAAAQTGPGPEELGAVALPTPPAVETAPAMRPALPRAVLEDAGAYRLYMRNAARLSAEFGDGAAVARSLRVGAAYEPKQLARGAVAYAAVAALADPGFTAAVHAAGVDPVARKTLASHLLIDPRIVARFDVDGTAAGRAGAALAGSGEAVRDAGRRVKQSAYDVQRASWSKAEVSGRVARLAEAKALSAAPLTAPAAEIDGLLQLTGGDSASAPAGTGQRPVVARGLALAALAVLGEADLLTVEPLLTDAACASCLRMSKLNLFQCLAVAKPWYEDVFCLGQHVLIDTGECIQSAALPKPAAPAALAARREEEAVGPVAALGPR